MPAAGEGTSASTLSVVISSSGSSRSIRSPTFFIHRTMVPSVIDSPIWGITTSVAMLVPSRYECSAAPCVACAASATASAMVGCAWMV